MKYCDLQQNNAFAEVTGEIRSPLSIFDRKGPVVCPKPRQVGFVIDNPTRPLRCHASHQAEVFDSKARAELLNIILKKEGLGAEQSATQLASSPPFFSGSPPIRATNPLVQDARFGDQKLAPLSALPSRSSLGLSSPSSSACEGGYVRMKFGHKPAAVRVEGFDCFNRDGKIPASPLWHRTFQHPRCGIELH
ncbi:hypothetical protein F0562_005279 [Nyssa sinensis]|uniref:Uncharacterized protein n=1 Tax=Nyssa sinensis TaxID=561372 RepID=A0A5J5AIV9_9ASTE|nr:hypothetical protein F0562_005279 [Nyssa sinensis]